MAKRAPKEIESILATFPGPTTLQPSKLKLAVLLLISVGFMALCAAGLRGDKTYIPLIGFLISGMMSLLFIAAWISRPTDLTLTAKGFELRNTWRGKFAFTWEEASDFRTIHIKGNRVCFRSARHKTSRWGSDRLLPDTYGLGAAKCAALFNAWRERALSMRTT